MNAEIIIFFAEFIVITVFSRIFAIAFRRLHRPAPPVKIEVRLLDLQKGKGQKCDKRNADGCWQAVFVISMDIEWGGSKLQFTGLDGIVGGGVDYPYKLGR